MARDIKVAKMPGAERPCEYLYFRYWEKKDKHRVYIKDYKGRDIGYIDLDRDDVVIIEDHQGSARADIDRAVRIFMEDYLDDVKAKHNFVNSHNEFLQQQILELSGLGKKP